MSQKLITDKSDSSKPKPSAPTFFGNKLKGSIAHLAAMVIGAATVYLYPSDGAKTVDMGANSKTGLTAADEASLAKQKAGGATQAERRAAALEKGQALLDAAKKSPETRPESTTFAKAADPAAIRRNNVAQAAVEDANSTGGHKQGSLDGAKAGAGGALALTLVASLMMRRKQAKALKEAGVDYNFMTDTQGLSGLVYGKTLEQVKNGLEQKKFANEGIASLRDDFAKHQARNQPLEYNGSLIRNEGDLKSTVEAERVKMWSGLPSSTWFPWRNKGADTNLPYREMEIPKETARETTFKIPAGLTKEEEKAFIRKAQHTAEEKEIEMKVETTTQLMPSAAHGTSNGERFTPPKPVRWWHLN